MKRAPDLPLGTCARIVSGEWDIATERRMRELCALYIVGSPRRRLLITCVLSCCCGLLIFTAPSVRAAPITFSGTSGSLAASAEFDTSGSNLIVTLTNTSTADVLQQPSILTSMFFEVSGSLLGLTPSTGSAVLPLGSLVLFGTSDPGNVVGGEWAYLEGIGASSPNGARYGISSAGFG